MPDDKRQVGMGLASDDIREAKAGVRARLKALRRTMPAAERARLSVVVEDRFFDIPFLARARTVMAFSSFGSEVCTDGIIGRLHVRGQRIVLPVVVGDYLEPVVFRPGDAMRRTSYGADEPLSAERADVSAIDVVIVPGLAFDQRGYRIGYGGGFYDRFLPRLDPRTLRVGIAYHCQLIEELPHGMADETVDLVVTDRETVLCRADRGKTLTP
jgi:5-formyltetrahydrofolate cyclo-ligase